MKFWQPLGAKSCESEVRSRVVLGRVAHKARAKKQGYLLESGICSKVSTMMIATIASSSSPDWGGGQVPSSILSKDGRLL